MRSLLYSSTRLALAMVLFAAIAYFEPIGFLIPVIILRERLVSLPPEDYHGGSK